MHSDQESPVLPGHPGIEAPNTTVEATSEAPRRGPFTRKDGLTNSEVRIANLVCLNAFSNKEIGNSLFVTEKTVKFHLTNIYKKLGAKNRAQLILLAHEKLKGGRA